MAVKSINHKMEIKVNPEHAKGLRVQLDVEVVGTFNIADVPRLIQELQNKLASMAKLEEAL